MVRQTAKETIMTTPTDRVRAALEIACGYTALVADGNTNVPIRKERAADDCRIIGEALRELEGMVIVPVEPTQDHLDKMAKFAIAARLSSEYTWRDYVRDLYGIVIAEYRG